MTTTQISLPVLLLSALLLASCGNSEKKENTDGEHTTSEATVESTSTDQGIALKQHADYTRLYAPADGCRITAGEVASVYDVPEDKVKETYNMANGHGGHDCTYEVYFDDGSKTVFSVMEMKMSKEAVGDQLKKLTSGSYEKGFMTTSRAGDNYIWKHPNQGYFVLYNPNYANGLRVRYRMVFKVSEEEKIFLEEKGLEAVELIIDKFKD